MSELKPDYGESSQYGEQYGAPYDAPGQKRGMSGCTKGCLIFGVIGVISVVVCCVRGWLYIRANVTTDVAEARSIADDIIDWQFNEEIEPQIALNMFFVRFVTMVEPDKGLIVIADSRYADPTDIGQQMDGQFRNQTSSSGTHMSEETRTLEEKDIELIIKGETISFQFNRTQGVDSGKEYWEVIGIVPGNDHPTFVMLKLLADVYDENAIVARLEDIK